MQTFASRTAAAEVAAIVVLKAVEVVIVVEVALAETEALVVATFEATDMLTVKDLVEGAVNVSAAEVVIDVLETEVVLAVV